MMMAAMTVEDLQRFLEEDIEKRDSAKGRVFLCFHGEVMRLIPQRGRRGDAVFLTTAPLSVDEAKEFGTFNRLRDTGKVYVASGSAIRGGVTPKTRGGRGTPSRIAR